MEPILKGIAASPGIAEGVVRIVHDARDSEYFNENDVLVAKLTEPSMVTMMNKASAIITELGGLTSHAAIVARELGVPAVVATKTATATLQNGMKVRVDGGKGEIYAI